LTESHPSLYNSVMFIFKIRKDFIIPHVQRHPAREMRPPGSEVVKKVIALTFLFSIILIIILPCRGSAVIPFHVGEKLTFHLKWMNIKAGEATLQVLPMETINGVLSYHFEMTARSMPFLDLIFKVRDRVEGYTDTQMNHTILYRKNQLEGRTHREIEVRFDWDRKEAHYTNFQKKRAPLPIQPDTFDPLSAFYFVRMFEPEKNMTIERSITDGKKCVVGRCTYIRRESIKVGKKRYDTWLLEPELKHVGGVFEKSRDSKIQLWVTADHRRMLVRIKSKVIIGSFFADLVEAE